MLKVTLTGDNAYGRLSITGVRSNYSARRLRQLRAAETTFVHRAKNGVYDPLTYYHLFDFLMQVDPGQDFRTSDIMRVLPAAKPQLVWDATTVGRVITDIAESMHEAYGRPIIGYTKRWNGMTYDTSAHPENRAAMTALHEDLYLLCEEVVQAELRGEREKRMDSPLRRCPSTMRVAVAV